MSQSYPAIRAFLRNHYSDERLAALLAHCEEGRLAFWSCCCLVGAATADHALQSAWSMLRHPQGSHYDEAYKLAGACEAENEFYNMAPKDNAARCALLIPIIHEEIARRDAEKQPLYTAAVKVSSSYNDWLKARMS